MLYWCFCISLVAAGAADAGLQDASTRNSEMKSVESIVGSPRGPYVMIALTGMVCYLFLLILQPNFEKFRPKMPNGGQINSELRKSRDVRAEKAVAGKEMPRNHKMLARLMARKEDKRAHVYKLAVKKAKSQALRGRGIEAKHSKRHADIMEVVVPREEQISVDSGKEILPEKDSRKLATAVESTVSDSGTSMDETIKSLMKFLEHEKMNSSNERLQQESALSPDTSKDLEKCVRKLKVQSAVVQALQCITNAQNGTNAPPPPGLEMNAEPGAEFERFLGTMQKKIATLQDRAALMCSKSSSPEPGLASTCALVPEAPPSTLGVRSVPKVSFDEVTTQKFSEWKLRTALSSQAKVFVPGQTNASVDFGPLVTNLNIPKRAGKLDTDVYDKTWNSDWAVVH